MVRVLLLLFLLFAMSSADDESAAPTEDEDEDDLLGSLDHCCRLGGRWADEHLSTGCDDFPVPVSGVSTHAQTLCVTAVEACCTRRRREQQCRLGVKAGQTGRRCLRISGVGGEAFQVRAVASSSAAVAFVAAPVDVAAAVLVVAAAAADVAAAAHVAFTVCTILFLIMIISFESCYCCCSCSCYWHIFCWRWSELFFAWKKKKNHFLLIQDCCLGCKMGLQASSFMTEEEEGQTGGGGGDGCGELAGVFPKPWKESLQQCCEV